MDAPRAIFPGTFNPFTHGHTDIYQRATVLFGRVDIAVAQAPGAQFSQSERCEMAQLSVPNARVLPFTGLLSDLLRAQQCRIIVRGLRDERDFVHEHTMSVFNSELLADVETVWLPCRLPLLRLSATAVRALAAAGGDCSAYVAPGVCERMRVKTA